MFDKTIVAVSKKKGNVKKKMQGKQGQANYKSFRLLCPSQNIGNCKFRESRLQ